MNAGLMFMFKGEVLGKYPVVQHFVFGEHFPANWKVLTDEAKATPMNPFLAAQLERSVVPGQCRCVHRPRLSSLTDLLF